MNDMSPITAKPKRTRRAKPASPKPQAQEPAPNSVEAAIEAAGRLTAEAAAMHAPIMSRAVVARNAADIRLSELDRERADLTDRQALLTAQYTAAMEGIEAHVKDIDETRAVILGGTNPAAIGGEA